MNAGKLPTEFSDLELYVANWALDSESARYHRKVRSTVEELEKFYGAMLPRMASIMNYMMQFSPDEMPEDARQLYRLGLSFMEVSHPVELKWGSSDIVDQFPVERFEFLVVRD